MATSKLTARSVADLPAGTHYDSDLKGFGVRIGAHSSSWFVEYRPGAGGRGVAKKRVKIGGMDRMSPEEARKLAKKELAAVIGGADPAKARAAERAALPFSAVAADYLERHVTPKRKAKTLESYERVVRLHLNPNIGSKKIAAITRTDMMAMHAAVGPESGTYVANLALAIASAIFTWANPDAPNPARKVERFREQSRERYLTVDEMQRLSGALIEAETTGLPYEIDADKPKSKHAPKPENRLTVFGPHVTGAIRLLLLTGCRLREILHLRWDEVDLEKGLLRLPDSKTGRKVVVLSEAAVEVLKALPRVGTFVVAGRNAGTAEEQPRHDLKRPWDAISARAGIGDVRLHDLRHTFASVGVEAGMGLPVIGGLLGHKSNLTTHRYAHVDASPARRAANEIAGRIVAAMGKQ